MPDIEVAPISVWRCECNEGEAECMADAVDDKLSIDHFRIWQEIGDAAAFDRRILTVEELQASLVAELNSARAIDDQDTRDSTIYNCSEHSTVTYLTTGS